MSETYSNDSIVTITDEGDCSIVRLYSRGNLDFVSDEYYIEGYDNSGEIMEGLSNIINAATSIFIESHSTMRWGNGKELHVIFIGNNAVFLMIPFMRYIDYFINEKGDEDAFGDHKFIFHLDEDEYIDEMIDLDHIIQFDKSKMFAIDSSKTKQVYVYELNDDYEVKSIETLRYKNKKERDNIIDKVDMKVAEMEAEEYNEYDQFMCISVGGDVQNESSIMRIYNRGRITETDSKDKIFDYVAVMTQRLISRHSDDAWKSTSINPCKVVHAIYSDKFASCYNMAVVNYITYWYTDHEDAFGDHTFMIHYDPKDVPEELKNCPIIEWDTRKEFELSYYGRITKYELNDNYDLYNIDGSRVYGWGDDENYNKSKEVK